MDTWTLIKALQKAGNDKETARVLRRSSQGIAVLNDTWARTFRVRERQQIKIMERLRITFNPDQKRERCWYCGNMLNQRCDCLHWSTLGILSGYKSDSLAEPVSPQEINA